jgi:hypothetical protein
VAFRVIQNGNTNQFRVELTEGRNSVRCVVSVALASRSDGRTKGEKKAAAIKIAKELTKNLLSELSK